MEHGFILIVAVFEICFSLVEIFLQHWHIIFLECIEERQVSIVVNHIWSRFDLINNLVLLVETDDMFNSLALVVLCATSKVERVIPTEPIEYFFVPIPCTLKEGILSIFISHLQTLEFEILEYLQHLEVLTSSGQKYWGLTVEIPLKTLFWPHFKELFNKLIILIQYCLMERRISLDVVNCKDL